MFVYRIMKYDRAANERNAITAVQLLINSNHISSSSSAENDATAGSATAAILHWFRLDDGVMGGSSETNHVPLENGNILHFKGTINTNGGGFCSIRSKLLTQDEQEQQVKERQEKVQQHEQEEQQHDQGKSGVIPSTATGVKIKFRGDGKTYKFLLSDGNPSMAIFGPKSPSWQADIPTKKLEGSNCNSSTSGGGMESATTISNSSTNENEEWEEATLLFSTFLPNAGGPSAAPVADKEKYTFRAEHMREVGFMLSLRLSDAQPNPPETFGTGIFPFSFKVKSIEVVE